MTVTHNDYERVKLQTLLLADVVELFLAGLAPETRAAVAVSRAIRLARAAIDVSETVADVYADTVEGINAVNAQVLQMKAEGRTPTHVEWEALRARIEDASRAIDASSSPSS